jgi:antitoxin VapB
MEVSMNEHVSTKKIVHVFKNGRSRAVRIPKEFDFEGDEVEMTRNRAGEILLRPLKSPKSLLEALAQMEPLDDEADWLPEIEDLPPEPVTVFDDWKE